MKSEIFGLVLQASSFAASTAHAADAMVVMKNFDYSPTELTVEQGTTVTWKNQDGEPHTVTSIGGLFRSPALDQSDVYHFKFDHPGVYKYICSIHPKMKATIIVK